MKIARSTKERVAAIKAESQDAKAKLETLRIRLNEHSGTKKIARGLDAVISKLEAWQRTQHV